MWYLQVLLSKGVEEGKILFLSLIAAPEGIHRICSAFPRVKLITSEIDDGIGPDFQVVPGMHTSRASASASLSVAICLDGLLAAADYIARLMFAPALTCTTSLSHLAGLAAAFQNGF